MEQSEFQFPTRWEAGNAARKNLKNELECALQVVRNVILVDIKKRMGNSSDTYLEYSIKDFDRRVDIPERNFRFGMIGVFAYILAELDDRDYDTLFMRSADGEVTGMRIWFGDEGKAPWRNGGEAEKKYYQKIDEADPEDCL